MGWYDYYPRYTPSRPKAVKGGIKAHSKRGDFGESWWAKRWIQVLESYNIGERLTRGRRYARQGQVLSIEMSSGAVYAKVQGSRPTPYKVSLEIPAPGRDSIEKLKREISGSIFYCAKLQSGQMPPQLEEVFSSAGVPLFPQKYKDLRTNCSCPDWSNPCKHIAAVCYLLAEEFDRDPFLILKWRGIEQNTLTSMICDAPPGKREEPCEEITAEKGRKKRKKKATPSKGKAHPDKAVKALPVEPATFWGRESAFEGITFTTSIPSMPAALTRRLGKFPFWRGEKNLQDTMEEIYGNASRFAVEAMAGGIQGL